MLSYLQSLRPAKGPATLHPAGRDKGGRRRSFRARVEAMEGRVLLATFQTGDVIVGGAGFIDWFRPDGTLVQTLDTSNVPNSESEDHTGLVFDSPGNLYATNFFAHTINKYDPSGTLLGNFGDT